MFLTRRLPATKKHPRTLLASELPRAIGTTVPGTHISPPSVHNNPTTALKPQWHPFHPKQTCHYRSQINWCHLCALPLGFQLESAQRQWPPPLKTSRHLQLWPLAGFPSLSFSSPVTTDLSFSPLPAHSSPIRRLWEISKWLSSGMRLSVELSFALSKCLCCISLIF